MKISEVLAFLKKEFCIRGDKEITPDTKLSEQDIDWFNGEVTQEEFEQAIPLCEQSKLIKSYSSELEQHINNQALEKGYSDAVSCASYANSSNEQWLQEAQDFIAWRDSCWEYAFDVQSQVEAGTITAPSLDEFIENAPPINWS
jgi:hypothetical protein